MYLSNFFVRRKNMLKVWGDYKLQLGVTKGDLGSKSRSSVNRGFLKEMSGLNKVFSIKRKSTEKQNFSALSV